MQVYRWEGCHSDEPLLVYVVTYAYNPATKQGYVYLPAKDDEFVVKQRRPKRLLATLASHLLW
jgi:hypothetical protein